MKQPLPGDYMFLFTRNNALSQLIAGFTHAHISHVQTIIDVGVSGTLQVISAEAEGLVPRWEIPEELGCWYAILTCEDWGFKQRDTLCKWLWDRKNIPYDIWGLASFVLGFDVNNENRIFCSEVCYLAPIEAIGYYLLNGVDHAYVSPRDLWISPALKTLDGSKKEVR